MEHVARGLEAGDNNNNRDRIAYELRNDAIRSNGARRGFRTEFRCGISFASVFMYRDFHHVNRRFKCKCAAIVLRMTIRIVFFLKATFRVCGEFYVSILGD